MNSKHSNSHLPAQVRKSSRHLLSCLGAFLLGLSSTTQAAPPDLTAGGVPNSTFNINLGPTGLEGWVYLDSNGTADARQIRVNKVDAGSPAAGILAVGDVILGVNGTGAEPVAFSSDARVTLAQAINLAEGRNPATLKLIRWRSGLTATVTITLEYMGGSYTATAPFNCPKSAAILHKGVNYIMTSEPGSGYGGFGANVLMAVNDPSNPSNAARQARAQTEARALNLTQSEINQRIAGYVDRRLGGNAPWTSGPALITQAEYYLQTGDSTVLPSIRARAIEIANGQSMFGTVGHNFALAGPNGENNGPYGIGYGPVNNAGLPCFLGLVLANKCGLTDAPILAGIDRSSKFFQYYADLGSVPYGENKEYIYLASNNGKAGLAALALGMLNGYDSQAKYFTKLSVYGANERDSGHTGAYFNHQWTPLGANLGGQAALTRYFLQNAALYDLARRWNGSFVYQPGGISNYGTDHRASWTILLTYAAPLAKLHITGKNANPALALNATDMAELNLGMSYNAAGRTTPQLLQDLAHSIPQVRWAAGREIANNRKTEHTAILPTLTNMAQNGATFAAQHGALFALKVMANDSAAPVLAGLLMSPNSKVRYAAADALDGLSLAAKTTHLNAIVNALIAYDRPILPLDPANPMHAEKAPFGSLLFGGNGVWGSGRLSTANRAQLYPTFRIIAGAPMGGTRNSAFAVASSLTKTDVENLAEVLVNVGLEPPPAENRENNSRNDAISVLQAKDIAEGVPMSVISFLEGFNDFQAPLGILKKYAASSLTVQPDPKVTEFCQALASNSDDLSDNAQAVLDAIAADQLPNKVPKKLTPFKRIDWVAADRPSLNLPATSTVLRVQSTDLANGTPVYTWRKVHGAGNVRFTPNGTGSAKNTSVVFDGTPGVYTFEVTMSDEKGLTEVSATVKVTLNGSGGTLPSNSAPTANPQSITAGQGTPTQIVLTGSDPEGQPLIYNVTNKPSHGTLSGTAPNLVYTAGLAYTGSDTIAFEVMDTEGLKSTSTVAITVGAVNNVGVAVYEPFQYPSGFFNGAASVNEIGFAGSWAAYSDVKITGGSLTYGSLRTNGGSLGNMAATTNAYGGHRAISPAALAGNGLLADGATLWFSAELGHPDLYYESGIYLALANSSFNPGGNCHWIKNEGSQVGVGVGVAVIGNEVRAARFGDASLGSTGTASHTYGNWSTAYGSIGSYSHRLVVGKITWGATTDKVEIFLPHEDLTLPATPSSTLSLNVNQSTFDTLTFSRINAPVIDEIRLGATYQSVLQGTVPMTEDTTAPSPDPMSFAVAPAPSGSTSITMTATPAFDLMGVEYYFDCTAGAGGDDSGWQASPVYTDTGLTPGVQYTYQVKARDKNPGLNETALSPAASAAIASLANVPNVVGSPKDPAEDMIEAAGLTVGTTTNATEYSLSVPTGHILTQSMAAGSTAAYGSSVNLVLSIGQDPALPTLASVNIVDNQNGGPVVANTPITYTLTFSEDIDAATLDATDFVNVGTAAVTIGTITEISPGVVTVDVTPTGNGILRFAVAAGASIVDAQGHAFNSTYETIDDSVITILLPSVSVPNVVGMTQSAATTAITSANLLVGTVDGIYSTTVAAGNVISQTPAGGSTLPGQDVVNLVVSLGPPPDTTRPLLVKTWPTDGTYSVEVNTPMEITFNESVLIGVGNITLRNLNDGTDVIVPVTDSSQVKVTGRTLTITPAVNLEGGKSYAVRISNGAVVDTSGNGFLGINNNTTWNFATSATPIGNYLYTENFEAPDVAGYVKGATPPTWVGANVAHGSTTHGLIDKSSGAFSVPDPNRQGYALRFDRTGITTAQGVIGTVTAGTTYEVSFDVIRDGGNSNGTGFSARMLAYPPGAARNDCQNDGTAVNFGSVTGNATPDGAPTRVTFNATVNAGSTAIGRDFAVRFLGSGSSAIVDNVRVRTITDQVAPVVAQLTPTDNSTNVSITDNLKIVFNKNIKVRSGFITLKDLNTGAQTMINIISSSQILINGDTLEINPTADLSNNTFYSVQIDSGAITDLVGNHFPGIRNDTYWTFNTGAVTDSQSPTIVAMTPADGANGVSNRTSLSLTFDENVVANRGSIIVKNLTDSTQMVIDASDSTQVEANGTQAIITPATLLGEAKNYAVQMEAGAFLDLAGNAHAGMADDFTWNFTADANNPPEIVSLFPIDEAVNFDITSNLKVTFDEPIALGTGNITLRNLITSSNLVINVNDASQVSINGAELTINPTANLGEVINYAVLIDSGAIRDSNGNSFAGITSDANWNFITGVSSVGLVFLEDFEAASGSPDVSASGSSGYTSKQTGSRWVRSATGFGADRHGIVDESSGQFTDPAGQQAYAFRYTNTAITTGQGRIGALTAGKTYRVSFNVVGDGSSGGGAYNVSLVTSPSGATLASRSGNYTGIPYQLVSFTYYSGGISDAALQGQDVAIRVAGATVAAIIDNVQVTVNGVAIDVVPPTLAGTGIVDNQGGAAIFANTPVNYTVAFSEDINASSVSAADFGNAGTSPVSFGAITETSPGVFAIAVTPTGVGTLRLRVNAGAVITDASGNALNTAAAILDDTTITVNAPNSSPVWAGDPVIELDATEDAGYNSTLADDASDADGNTLTFAKVSGPSWLSVAADGTLSGTPTNGDVGPNTFTVSVSDGIALAMETTLGIGVANTNDAPAFAANPLPGGDATEDAAYSGTLAGTASDMDAGATLNYAKINGPSWLSIAPNGEISGTPTNSHVGPNSFTVIVSDGIAPAVEATLNITVTNTNDAPTFAASPILGGDATEDAIYTGTLAGSASDVDTDANLTYAKVSGPAWLSVAADGSMTGTPANGDVGTNSFTVSVSDGIAPAVQGTLAITVINTNDAPVFTSSPILGGDATEDSVYTGSLAGAASDDDTDANLTYAKVSGPTWLSVAADGSMTGTPANDDVGANSFTVSVSDGIAPVVEATLNITVINTNDAPTFASSPIIGGDATEDSPYTATLVGSASDVDTEATLAFAKISGPAWLSVAANGVLSGTPANGDVGAGSFTVSVSDGIAPAVEATLNITVSNTNDAPTFATTPIIRGNATENAAYTGTLAGSASDVDAGATLTYAKASGPAWLSVAADGTLSGTPVFGDAGTNAFTVSVSDGISPAVQATLNITVIAAPVGEIVFADNFEPGANIHGGTTPNVTTYTAANTSQQANTALWVRHSVGFSSTRNGLVDESENGGTYFTDPTGTQAYGFRYTNSGVTSAVGKIGVLTAGKTYTVTFDVVKDGWNGGLPFTAQLVAFSSGAARNSNATPAGSLMLRQFTGNASSDGLYKTVSFTYTTGGIADSAHLGFDLGIRFNGATSSANIDNVSVTIANANPAPSPWASQNMGAYDLEGRTDFINGVFRITAAGSGIGGTADSYRSTHQVSSGDCEITARVSDLSGATAAGKAGVMIRESLSSNAREAGVWLTPAGEIAFTYRSATGGTTTTVTAPGMAAPYWVRINRTGNSFTAYTSADGAAWAQLGTPQTIGMATSAYLSLGVCSGSTSQLATGTMNNVTATP